VDDFYSASFRAELWYFDDFSLGEEQRRLTVYTL